MGNVDQRLGRNGDHSGAVIGVAERLFGSLTGGNGLPGTGSTEDETIRLSVQQRPIRRYDSYSGEATFAEHQVQYGPKSFLGNLFFIKSLKEKVVFS